MNRLFAGALCAMTIACGSPAPTSSSPPPATSFALTGRVSDINTGTSLAGATVAILDGVNASRTTTSDVSGAFRIADLTMGGFTVRVRRDGYDSWFRSVNLTADTSIDVQLVPAMTTLAGTWAGTLSFTPQTGSRQDLTIPQLTMAQSGSIVSSNTFSTSSSYQAGFTGTLQDPSSIGTTTSVNGTLTLLENIAGRNLMTCRGTGAFTGTINWTRMSTATSQITLDCGMTYSNVTLSLVRQQ